MYTACLHFQDHFNTKLAKMSKSGLAINIKTICICGTEELSQTKCNELSSACQVGGSPFILGVMACKVWEPLNYPTHEAFNSVFSPPIITKSIILMTRSD